MSNIILYNYAFQQLQEFYDGTMCCKKFLWCMYYYHTENFMKRINELNLNVRSCLYKNQEAVIVYKNTCLHITDQVLTLRLTPKSITDMYILHVSTKFIDSPNEMHISSDYFSPGSVMPTVAPHRFSFPLKQSIPHLNVEAHKRYQANCPIDSVKTYILEALQRNRVLLVSGGPNLDKSCAIPMIIMEQYIGAKILCKIICAEREQIFAMFNSDRLAQYFNEPVGSTIGYQVQLQSCISDLSSLVFTTAQFFLRVLMGQTITDCFDNITHVVVADVHLHQAYTDILLRQLKETLKYHLHLKIILLSDYTMNQHFLNYFGQGEEVNLHEFNYNTSNNLKRCNYPKIFYMDDIPQLLKTDCPSKTAVQVFQYLMPAVQTQTINELFMDLCLEQYEETVGSEKSFNHILYMVNGELASINYCHTITGRTIIMLSCLFDKINHLKILLQHNADPYIVDKHNMNALNIAILKNHYNCVDLLRASSCFRSGIAWRQHNYNQSYNYNYIHKDNIDYYLIIDILYTITTDLITWPNGDIMIYLPSYEHLIRLNYNIVKQKILGNLPVNLNIHLLHSDTDKQEFEALLTESSSMVSIRCILTTELAEGLNCFHNIRYIIDTGRRRKQIYNDKAQCKETIYEWTPKHNMENRLLLLKSDDGTESYCFRLITTSIYKIIPDTITPELLTTPLERVCLTVKLLAPEQTILTFLSETITQPSLLQIYGCIKYMKRINMLNENEEATWLACRLIDIPVEFQYGKLLVLAILLQCLDPILTIVSFMSLYDPIELSIFLDDLIKPFADNIRIKIKEEHKRLADNHLSDHIYYIRLYQEWQNLLSNANTNLLLNEYRFLLDGLMEHITDKRTQLVGLLRSSQLIHNKGDFSMLVINIKSHSWPLIKAVLAAGLYPNICVIDAATKRLKSSRKCELVLHPNTVLRDCELSTCQDCVTHFNTPWIVYSQEVNSWNCRSINACTVVSPIAIALFAGQVKMSTRQIQFLQNPIDNKNNTYNNYSHNNNNNGNININNNIIYNNTDADANANNCPVNVTSQVTFCVDEWISFTMDYNDAQLLLKTRQCFYNVYLNYLEHCNAIANFHRNKACVLNYTRVLNCLQNVLQQEDDFYKFKQPSKIGLRPKAMPNKNTKLINKKTTEIMTSYLHNVVQCDKYLMENNIFQYSIGLNLLMQQKQFLMAYQNDMHYEECKQQIIVNLQLWLNSRTYNQNYGHLSNQLTVINNDVNNNYPTTNNIASSMSISSSSSASISVSALSSGSTSIIPSNNNINNILIKGPLTYVIMYTNNPDQLFCVSLVEWRANGQINLKDCFMANINLYSIQNIICMDSTLPRALIEKRSIIPLKREVGEMILNLFAYHNQWLHKL